MADDMFRPPVNRAMRVLDRSFFHKRIPLSAARILNPRDITKCRQDLSKSKDVLLLERYNNIRPDPSDQTGVGKCILLRQKVDEHGQEWPWSSTVADLERDQLINVIPYELNLDYDYWTYHDIARAIMPAAEGDEVPSGFTHVGHVAHLNLREQYLDYKNIIGQVLLDKNPGVRTVINKIDDVGEESEYRTFRYEILAGDDDMQVSVREADCAFHFDYSKVYWNSRLSTEHERLVSLFQPGQAVCDVMAGIGPFAVPAGKKRVFVLANDLNPDGFSALSDAISRNKVDRFVQASNGDGRQFIRDATARLLREPLEVQIQPRPSRQKPAQPPQPSTDLSTPPSATIPPPKQSTQIYTRPRVFSHYVMNLPATAITFLPSFIGLYNPTDRALLPTDTKMPMIHVHCFSTKSDDNAEEKTKICKEISEQLGTTITPEMPDVDIHDVRDVAPKKRMFCASFRLPEEVAFRHT